MNHYGPFQTRVGLYQRFPNFIDLIVRNSPDTSAYGLWGAPSLVDAYGNPTGSGVGGAGGTLLLMAESGAIAQTQGASRAGCSKVPENRKGQTSFQVDPRDLPFPDQNLLYFRVQERRLSTGAWAVVPGPIDPGAPILGPILVAAPVSHGYQPSAAYTLWGIAPTNTLCTEGDIPIFDVTAQVPNPLYIVFPRPASSVMIKNVDAAADLLFSYGVGHPMIRLPAGESWGPDTGHGPTATTEMLFAEGAGGSVGASGCQFALYLLVDHSM